MTKPVVAIVGRPNVGKSTLFNVLAGDYISITNNIVGVTRDRIYANCIWLNHSYTLVDTGGIILDSSDIIFSQIREQVNIAISTSDVIIFLVDFKQGLIDSDKNIAKLLRNSHKQIILVVNKVDNFNKEIFNIYEFYNLGIGDPIPISAISKKGIGDMLDILVKYFPKKVLDKYEYNDKLKISVVGKPNVGKSSLINKLIGENRLIVSNIAGTTRNAIDTFVKYKNKEYIFIDTAGIRRKNKIKEKIEKDCIISTVNAIIRCDVAIMMIDATNGITEQDAKIAGIIHKYGKGIVIAVNKWDIIKKDNKIVNRFINDIYDVLSFINYADIVFISAKSGQRIEKLYEYVNIVHKNQCLRIKTGVLNEIIIGTLALRQPVFGKGKRLKIFYVTQVSIKPPTFVIFVNDKRLLHFSYIRYIENRIRDAFKFTGTCLNFIIRDHK